MFKKKDKAAERKTKVTNMPISSIISNEMRVTGDINFKGKARIDGEVQGDIRGEYLVISESGAIQGNLDLETLICHGKVEGDIKAEQITAHSTASINGCLTAANLTVETGATLEGELKAARREQATAPPLARVAQVAAAEAKGASEKKTTTPQPSKAASKKEAATKSAV